MSDADSAGFGKFVPGFDFLQNLAKGASASVPQMPNLGSWVAPTLSVEELDKRIEELKNVQFWLEQNSRALSATIQALEVQRMTLATLKGMNFNLGDLAKVFTPQASAPKAAEKPPEKAPEKPAPAEKPPEAAPEQAAKSAPAAAGASMVDPLQLWGSLTQQFQQIAATALKDVGTKAATDLGKGMAASMARGAATPAKKAAAKKTTTKKAPVRKAASRKTTGK
jgi:pyruvate/2-oxoglutarate dehydrogenase complex dihydrolipoamide acyltransferase (E2) component